MFSSGRQSTWTADLRQTLHSVALSAAALSCWVGATVQAGDVPLKSPEQVFRSADNGSPLILPVAYQSTQAGQHLLRARGGMTYLNRTSESHVGGTYGLEGILPITDSFGGHAAARVNQFSGGTQVVGTIGGYKTANSRNGSMLGRVGGSLLFDLFGDFRGDDVFLSQLRAQLGYAVSDDTAAGVTLTVPLNEDRDPLFLVPGGPIGTYRTVTTGGVFVSHYFGEHLTYANVGYREDPDSLYLDVAVRTPLVGDSLFAYANGNYIEQSGAFSSWVGLEFRFGRSTRGSRSGRTRGVWDDPTIANSFNYGENSAWHNTRDVNASGQPGEMTQIDPPELELD